jgi:hypothetical protein
MLEVNVLQIEGFSDLKVASFDLEQMHLSARGQLWIITSINGFSHCIIFTWKMTVNSAAMPLKGVKLDK